MGHNRAGERRRKRLKRRKREQRRLATSRWWISYHDSDVEPPEGAVILTVPNDVLRGVVIVPAASAQEARALFKDGKRGPESVQANRGPFRSKNEAESWAFY